MTDVLRTDVLVIGCGAAGLTCAVAASHAGSRVVVISKGPSARGCSTAMAGAIVNAALGITDPGDDVDAHIRDTIEAGCFVNEEPQVKAMAEGIVREIPRLEACGVRFTLKEGRLAQIRSAGHRHPRSLLFANFRGTDLADPLLATARGLGVGFIPGLGAVSLLRHDGEVVGALFLDQRTSELTAVQARTMVLATGGAGLFYESTGIPPLTPGDGYALAYEAGCTLIDLEFVQFYPTSLVGDGYSRRLVPYDYLLGRGAVLRNALGEDVVAKRELPEPAMITRSQLAAAIGREISDGNSVDGALLLDCTKVELDFDDLAFRRLAFADFVSRTRAAGHDPLSVPLRVTPIVHHFMGGVRVDARGETGVPGLLACGEAAGGTHGANRLAGNAFTEAISSGFRAGERAAERGGLASEADLVRLFRPVEDRVRERLSRRSGPGVSEVVAGLRHALSEGASACRDRSSLLSAREQLRSLAVDAEVAQANSPQEVGTAPTLPGLVRVAAMLVESCLAREESRGAHVRFDFPEEDDRFLLHFGHSVRNSKPVPIPISRIARRDGIL